MRPVFGSEQLRVRHVVAGAERSGSCVVTFDSYTDHRTLERPGFGEQFFRGCGIDAVHVVPVDNDWYQYAEAGAAMEAVRGAVAPYRRVVAYGSSMGAYAAIRLGQLAGAEAILALSPQFSIDPRVVPWERRWKAASAGFREVWEGVLPLPTRAETWIVYDPEDLDRRHIARYGARMRAGLIPLPGAGHPVTGFLAQLGLLQEAIIAFAEGRFEPEALRQEAMARRGESAQYLVTTSKRMPARRRAERVRLMREAVRLAPGDASVLYQLAIELRHARLFGEALACHRETLALEPGHPNLLLEYSHTLQAAGEIGQALAAMEQAAAQPRTEALFQRRLNKLRARRA